jgi:hypothetical protein
MNELNFDDWQKEILEAEGNILLCTGRQVGKTTIFAKKASDRLLKKPTKIIVVSLTEDQAQLIIQMVLTFLEKTNVRMIKTGRFRPTKNKIELRNGSTIISRPVGITGDSVRGFTGDVLIVDEASRMNEAVFSSAMPVLLTTAGEIWLCSTPFGKKGYFYECFKNVERFKVFHKSSVDVITNRAISASWNTERREKALRFLDDEKKSMSKTRFGQEYLGMFMEDLAQFFPDELITRCMTAERQTIIKADNYYLGVDLARMGEDESTFEVIKMTQDKRLIHIENQITKRTYLSQSTKHIINMNRLYDFQRIFIDDEGIGVGVFDHLIEDDELKRKVVSINNSKRMIDYRDEKKETIFKEVLYNNLLRLMELGEIELLKDDNIFLSLKSVQYEYTSDTRGKPHLKIFGTYTHIAEGLIRGAWCVKYKPLNIWIKSL